MFGLIARQTTRTRDMPESGILDFFSCVVARPVDWLLLVRTVGFSRCGPNRAESPTVD